MLRQLNVPLFESISCNYLVSEEQMQTSHKNMSLMGV